MGAVTHTAAGPALGYLFQFQVALLELVSHALANSDAAVTLEVYDDVAFHFGDGVTPRQVIQVHHSVNSDRELTDTGAKLWRTLAIWASQWPLLGADEDCSLVLLSTQTAADGTALAALTARARNPERALEILTAIAQDANGLATTAVDRAAFMQLASHQRRDLINHALFVDRAGAAVDMRSRLEAALLPTHESRFVPAMAEIVEGWWWPRVARALVDHEPIRAEEAREQIDGARRSLSDTALPVTGLEDFDTSELPDLDPEQARFMVCLRDIDASAVRRAQALDDYRRTFAHRSRWTRHGLLWPREIERYEDDLFADWLIRCDAILRALDGQADTAIRTTAGHELWDRVETEVSRPLRPHTADGFIVRGSFHQLAQDERLAWHPDSASRFLNGGET
jgi:hypothetical protein